MKEQGKPAGGNGKGGGHRGHGGNGGDHETEPNSERWLLTYADLITLLMVFFVVLYAMAQVDQAKYEALSQGLTRAFVGGGNLVIKTDLGTGDGMSVPDPQAISGQTKAEVRLDGKEAIKYIGDVLSGEELLAEGKFTVRSTQRGLMISLVGSAAFDPGKAELKPEFLPVLDGIAERLKRVANDISVEGFTDSDPIHTAEYPSNWYLSVARANQVRDYLERRGVAPERLIVVGYGETRPVWPNGTAEGKAKNRRVDVVVLREKQVVEAGQDLPKSKPR